MPATTTNLFLLQDLDDVSKTEQLAESDREALQAVADWIKSFVVKPHKDLGRAGTVCPYLPGSLERNVLWLAPERIADPAEPDLVELMSGYQRLLLKTQHSGGDDTDYQVVVVVRAGLRDRRTRQDQPARAGDRVNVGAGGRS